jgi:hypothetical protein
MIEPLVEYGRSHKYYANVNSLTIKLLTESPKRGNDWLVELKSTLNSIQHISAGILPFEQSLDRATTYMNAMIDSLPITECTYKLNQMMSNEQLRSLTQLL